MNTKLLYVLVSDESDIYLEQASVSMFSARLHNPQIHITLLMDDLTDKNLIGQRRELLKPVSEKIVISLDAKYTNKERSRILKTGARLYVHGDFLFIDCDTIVAAPLDDIDTNPIDLGAVMDCHTTLTHNPYRNMIFRHAQSINNVLCENEPYFNSGIILVRDTEVNHAFYERWQTNWKKGLAGGVSMDQPSFSQTNRELNYPIQEISGIWNCQIRHGMKYWNIAKIIHYLCTNGSSGENALYFWMQKCVYQQIKTSGISDNLIPKIQYPFEQLCSCVNVENAQSLSFHSTSCYKTSFFLYKEHPYLFHLESVILKIMKKVARYAKV